MQDWRDAHLMPDWPHFERTGKDYAKLYLDPWYRLTRRTPPARLRWAMIEAVLDVRNAWENAAQQREDVAYLAVWLFWPDFMNSQVVMANSEQAGYYRGLFPQAGQPRPLPVHLGGQSRLATRLAHQPWLEHLHEEPVDAEDYAAFSSKEKNHCPARLIASSYAGNFYLVEFGRVWIAESSISS